MAITESWLKANSKKERAKAITKTDRDGLLVRVSPKGKITYSLRYYYNNKQTRIDLGSYPLLSLKEARVETLRFRKNWNKVITLKSFANLKNKPSLPQSLSRAYLSFGMNPIA